MTDLMAQLRHWQEQIAAMPEPVAYIVIDHAHRATKPPIEGRDGRGRKYVVCSPSVLDAAKHTKYAEINVVADPMGIVAPGLIGIPLYRREDMAEGWPQTA